MKWNDERKDEGKIFREKEEKMEKGEEREE